jgi:hypothetical protein
MRKDLCLWCDFCLHYRYYENTFLPIVLTVWMDVALDAVTGDVDHHKHALVSRFQLGYALCDRTTRSQPLPKPPSPHLTLWDTQRSVNPRLASHSVKQRVGFVWATRSNRIYEAADLYGCGLSQHPGHRQHL